MCDTKAHETPVELSNINDALACPLTYVPAGSVKVIPLSTSTVELATAGPSLDRDDVSAFALNRSSPSARVMRSVALGVPVPALVALVVLSRITGPVNVAPASDALSASAAASAALSAGTPPRSPKSEAPDAPAGPRPPVARVYSVEAEFVVRVMLVAMVRRAGRW